jgi:hypothetical protein
MMKSIAFPDFLKKCAQGCHFREIMLPTEIALLFGCVYMAFIFGAEASSLLFIEGGFLDKILSLLFGEGDEYQ